MKLKVTVSVECGSTVKSADNELVLADVVGIDRTRCKEDFLQQAESLIRSVSENQVGALFDSALVEEEEKSIPPEDEEGRGGIVL